jgi:hypothetical protein
VSAKEESLGDLEPAASPVTGLYIKQVSEILGVSQVYKTFGFDKFITKDGLSRGVVLSLRRCTVAMLSSTRLIWRFPARESRITLSAYLSVGFMDAPQ